MMTMTQSSAVNPAEGATALSQDERLAAAARYRRFGYILLALGTFLGVAGVAASIFTSNPVFLVLLGTTVFDVVLALRQFAAARKV